MDIKYDGDGFLFGFLLTVQHVHVLEPVARVLVKLLKETGRSFSIRLPIDRHFMNSSISGARDLLTVLLLTNVAEERKAFMTTVVADAERVKEMFVVLFVF